MDDGRTVKMEERTSVRSDGADRIKDVLVNGEPLSEKFEW